MLIILFHYYMFFGFSAVLCSLIKMFRHFLNFLLSTQLDCVFLIRAHVEFSISFNEKRKKHKIKADFEL